MQTGRRLQRVASLRNSATRASACIGVIWSGLTASNAWVAGCSGLRVFAFVSRPPNNDSYGTLRAIRRGKPVSERLSQDQLEELELDADEIRAIRCRNTNGNPSRV
jgi:hypothetical protein